MLRVALDGRHLAVGGFRHVAKGVTYGSFLPRADGHPFPDAPVIERDLAAMAIAGMNTVRTYSVPPDQFLEVAKRLGLRVIVGLDYHDLRMEGGQSAGARRRVRDAGYRAIDDALEHIANRPEVLAVSVGNEIPGDLVRLHGPSKIERLLGDLVERVHLADPALLATYTNYPTTEYLDIPGLDLVTFNVFLEDRVPFRRYLKHLQIIGGARPLILTELGSAAQIHGEEAQAEMLQWQLDTVEELGLAGATVFSWTDEWAVGRQRVEGWGFGLTREDRSPRQAFDVTARWARRGLRDLRAEWPRVSAIVCAYNEQATLRESLASLEASDYPELEVIICDDGSTDTSGEIAREFPFKYLPLDHGGLSRARNAGLEVASGEIVAYLDADAVCHPHWPYFLALSFQAPSIVASGGPNLPFADVPLTERAVALSPGSPAEVLIGDDRAEHVPGCNMAFRADALRHIGGFDPLYTSAGDDVDMCWKLLEQGGQIAFSPAAQVRHHRRSSIRRYLRQQCGYGRAERLLMAAHPKRFNRLGQARWAGFIYGSSALLPRFLRPVVYHGAMGTGPYQTVVMRRAEVLANWGTALVPLVFVVVLLSLVAALVWPWAAVAAAAGAVSCAVFCWIVALSAPLARDERRTRRLRALIALLHLCQPLVRAWGRVRTPRRAVATPDLAWVGDRHRWLQALLEECSRRHLTVRAGSPTERWDLRCWVGPFLRAHIGTAVVWGWVPRHSVAYGFRWTCAGPVLGTLMLAREYGPRYAGAAVLTFAAALAGEGLVLRYRLRGAVAATLRGFEPEPLALVGMTEPWRSEVPVGGQPRWLGAG